ncbi:MAG: cysteine desulfurase [Spongiibacteraceae bacterium]|jgi:cysteine desulfurase/selenocysteine lyase|nr:cysteine desulfurase [Spongiibacteraceae bacterium]
MTAHQPVFDVEALRRQFPILHQEVHGRPLIYLDNAATTQKPQAVIDAIDRYYAHDNANVHRGVHSLSERATAAMEQARESVRSFLNAGEVAEVIFTRGTTEAINLVAHGFAREVLRPGDEVLITALEHHANIVPWQQACAASGATLKVADIDDNGEVVLADFEAKLSERTRIAAFAHVSNALGTINPIEKMIALARAAGAAVLIDGAQAVAHTPVDVQALDCDFYALSGHKLYGPTGIGVLYGRHEWLERLPVYQTGGDMIREVSFDKSVFAPLPHKFEAGTPHIAGVIGLGAAIEWLRGVDWPALIAHEDRLLARATERAAGLPGMTIVGRAQRKAGVLSFMLDGVHPHDIGTILDFEGIAIRAGHHCAMPVMTRFNVPATARASFAAYNTLAEVDRLFEALDSVRRTFA